MAYINQDDKAKLAAGIKAVLKQYGVKGSISIRHHSTLTVKLKSGKIDFQNECPGDRDITKGTSVNHYWIEKNFSGTSQKFLLALKDAMNANNYDNSDVQTDYFDVGYYIDIKIGTWDTPYQVVA